MLKLLAIVSTAILAVVVVATLFGEPRVDDKPLAKGIGQQVSEMAERGFDRVDPGRLDGVTILSFERDVEEMISILDQAGNVVGHWQKVEAESF